MQQLHYHVLATVDHLPQFFKDTSSKPYTIPRLFTCFQLLIRGSSQIGQYFEVMKKFQEAVSYNNNRILKVSISKKKLPKVNLKRIQDVQTKTEFLPTNTIDRLYSIYNGGLDDEHCKILDILKSGSGCLHVEYSLILVNFDMESKSFN